MAARTMKSNNGAGRQKEKTKITLQLDNVDSDDSISSHVQLCVGQDALTAVTSQASKECNVVSIDNNALDLSDKTSKVTAYLTNTEDITITKLLVRPDENQQLKISAAVISDKIVEKFTRIPIEKVVLSNGPGVRDFVVSPAQYSLLQHVRNVFGGYLGSDFYEKISDHGYGLTMRSLIRHAMNNVEMYMGQNQVTLDSANRELERKDDAERLISSFAKNVYVADTKRACGDRRGESMWRAGAGSSFVAQCESGNRNTSNDFVCQQVRRQLGIDESFSTVESSVLIGVVAVGITLSVIFGRRKQLVPKIGHNSAPTSMRRFGFLDSAHKTNFTGTKSFKN